MQGTYPVIFLSFANIKQDTYQKTLLRIKKLVDEIYNRFPELANIEGLTEEQKVKFTTISDKNNEEKMKLLNELMKAEKANYMLAKSNQQKIEKIEKNMNQSIF